MKSKFLDALLKPKGLSARLNNLFHVPDITRKAVEWLTLPFDSIETARMYGKNSTDATPMSMQELFTTWCAGQRMFVTVKNQKKAERLIKEVAPFGIQAQIAGQIIETPAGDIPHLQITARFDK